MDDDIDDDMDICSVCRGSGKIKKEEKCKYCNGEGYTGYNRKECSKCVSGVIMELTTIKCPRCWGGNVGIIDPDCYKCGGAGVVRYYVKKSCTSCDGTGYIKVRASCSKCNASGIRHYEVDCSTCKGTGYVSNKCTVTYDANGGTDAPEKQVVKSGEKFTLSTTKPIHEKYDFLGWTTDKEIYYPEYVAGSELTVQNDMVLYAVWDIPHTVVYDANGGYDAPESQIKKIGVPLTVSENIPQYEGKIFLGWSTDETATEAEYQPGDSYYDDTDIYLYAIWKDAYSIKISQTNIQETRSRYSTSKLHTIKIENDGSYATGELTVSLLSCGDEDISMFTISANSISSIESGAYGSFTVSTTRYLPGGTYRARIVIDGEHIEEESIYIELRIICNVTVKACEGGSLKDKYGYKKKELKEEIIPGNYIHLSQPEPDDETVSFYGFYVNGKKLNTNGCTITRDCEIEARFSFSSHSATISSSIGGTVSNYLGSNELKTGAYITLKAVPDSGYNFSGWFKYNKEKEEWEKIGTDRYYNLYIDACVKEYKIEARFVPIPISTLEFLDSEVIIRAEDGGIPQDAVFEVERIVPPPEEIIEKVKNQYGVTSSIIDYYGIRLKALDGTFITELDGEITICMKYTDEYVDSVKIRIFQEDSNGNLIDMESWIENGYICYRTNWLEVY